MKIEWKDPEESERVRGRIREVSTALHCLLDHQIDEIIRRAIVDVSEKTHENILADGLFPQSETKESIPPNVSPVGTTGAVRGNSLAGFRYDLLHPAAMAALARAYAEGATKYGDGNWEQGMPVLDLANHMLAHLWAWFDGDTSEDHPGHMLWNAMAMVVSWERWPGLNENLRQLQLLRRTAGAIGAGATMRPDTEEEQEKIKAFREIYEGEKSRAEFLGQLYDVAVETLARQTRRHPTRIRREIEAAAAEANKATERSEQERQKAAAENSARLLTPEFLAAADVESKTPITAGRPARNPEDHCGFCEDEQGRSRRYVVTTDAGRVPCPVCRPEDPGRTVESVPELSIGGDSEDPS